MNLVFIDKANARERNYFCVKATRNFWTIIKKKNKSLCRSRWDLRYLGGSGWHLPHLSAVVSRIVRHVLSPGRPSRCYH